MEEGFEPALTRDMRAMEANSPWFWAAMSAAALVGVAVSYPVNYWLVKNQLKRALGKGGTPSSELPEAAASSHAGHDMTTAGMSYGPAASELATGHDMAAMPGTGSWLKVWSESRICRQPRPGRVPESRL